MNKQQVLNALNKAKESSNKRNFSQTIDLIIILKDLDLKKPDHQLDFFLPLHYSNGRTTKICGLVGPEMAENAKKELDFVVLSNDFADYAKDKKKVKKLAEEYTFFVAQANLMGKIAATFGRVFGPKNKMPNPKSGCIVPPNANLTILKDKLKNTVRIQVKKSPQLQIAVGKEDMKEEEILENIMTVYNQVVHHLPNESHNIGSIMVKLTMGPTIKIGSDNEKGNQK